MCSAPDLSRNPSEKALFAVRSAGFAIDGARPVEPLNRKPDRVIFRVHCLGDRPASVIAKRAAAEKAAIEQTVYESILERLPVRKATLYGAFDDGDDKWLVLEDIGDVEPAFDDNGVIQELSAWLAIVHRSVSELVGLPRLPDRGPAHFRTRLQQARSGLDGRLRAASDPRERKIFHEAVLACDAVADRWEAVALACEGVPPSLVHGDLAAQNLRLSAEGGCRKLVVLDWEKAGWGVPAVDLAHVDLGAYSKTAGGTSLGCAPRDLERAYRAGRLFRVLVHEFASKPPSEVKRYTARLWAGIEELG
jgi:hypothetical protein